MKTQELISLAALALLLAQCKTAAPTASLAPAPSLIEVSQTLDTVQKVFFRFGNSTHGTPQQALILTENWLQSQPNVASVEDVDSTYIYIGLQSGLTAVFSIDLIGSDGLSVTRGGPPQQSPPQFRAMGNSSSYTISNKKVLIWSPPYNEFYRPGDMQHVLDLISKSGLGLDITLDTESQCTYQLMDHMGDYGLVILDTHGLPDAFLTGSRVTFPIQMPSASAVGPFIDGQLGAGTYNRLLSGHLRFQSASKIQTISTWWLDPDTGKARVDLWIPSKHIATLGGVGQTVILGNMCYSGFSVPYPRRFVTNPIATAFSAANPASYYCYAFADGRSQVVYNVFAKSMEDTLLRGLMKDHDSTGRAYLRSDLTEFSDPRAVSLTSGDFFFKHYGSDSYSYSYCIDTFTDARDGQRYHAVCIGDQTWMAQNLNFNAPGSHCYQDVSSNCDTFGRFYNWSTMMQGAAASSANPSGVQGVCPKGWHVPSNAEWTQLIDGLGGQSVAGTALKDTILWQTYTPKPAPGTNSSGFSGLPAGTANLLLPSPWAGVGTETWFWTTSSDPTNPNYPYFGMALQWTTSSALVAGTLMPSMETSCRCVKDP